MEINIVKEVSRTDIEIKDDLIAEYPGFWEDIYRQWSRVKEWNVHIKDIFPEIILRRMVEYLARERGYVLESEMEIMGYSVKLGEKSVDAIELPNSVLCGSDYTDKVLVEGIRVLSGYPHDVARLLPRESYEGSLENVYRLFMSSIMPSVSFIMGMEAITLDVHEPRVASKVNPMSCVDTFVRFTPIDMFEKYAPQIENLWFFKFSSQYDPWKDMSILQLVVPLNSGTLAEVISDRKRYVEMITSMRSQHEAIDRMNVLEALARKEYGKKYSSLTDAEKDLLESVGKSRDPFPWEDVVKRIDLQRPSDSWSVLQQLREIIPEAFDKVDKSSMVKYEGVVVICPHVIDYLTMVHNKIKDYEIHDLLVSTYAGREVGDVIYCRVCGEELTYNPKNSGITLYENGAAVVNMISKHPLWDDVSMILSTYLRSIVIIKGGSGIIKALVDAVTTTIIDLVASVEKKIYKNSPTPAEYEKYLTMSSKVYGYAALLKLLRGEAGKIITIKYNPDEIAERFVQEFGESHDFFMKSIKRAEVNITTDTYLSNQEIQENYDDYIPKAVNERGTILNKYLESGIWKLPPMVVGHVESAAGVVWSYVMSPEYINFYQLLEKMQTGSPSYYRDILPVSPWMLEQIPEIYVYSTAYFTDDLSQYLGLIHGPDHKHTWIPYYRTGKKADTCEVCGKTREEAIETPGIAEMLGHKSDLKNFYNLFTYICPPTGNAHTGFPCEVCGLTRDAIAKHDEKYFKKYEKKYIESSKVQKLSPIPVSKGKVSEVPRESAGMPPKGLSGDDLVLWKDLGCYINRTIKSGPNPSIAQYYTLKEYVQMVATTVNGIINKSPIFKDLHGMVREGFKKFDISFIANLPVDVSQSKHLYNLLMKMLSSLSNQEVYQFLVDKILDNEKRYVYTANKEVVQDAIIRSFEGTLDDGAEANEDLGDDMESGDYEEEED